MTTTTAYLCETCPAGAEATDTYFIASAPGADTWACPTCGAEWVVDIAEKRHPASRMRHRRAGCLTRVVHPGRRPPPGNTTTERMIHHSRRRAHHHRDRQR